MKYVFKDYDIRYFAGIKLPNGIAVEDTDNEAVPTLWNRLVSEVLHHIPNMIHPNKFIGLECFSPDFKETRRFDYYALVQTESFVDNEEHFVAKKLPKGKYICFEILFNNLDEEIRKCHNYIQSNNIKVNTEFDYTEYLDGEDYSNEKAKVHFSFLLI